MNKKLALIHDKASEVSELLKLMAHADRMIVLCLLSDGKLGVSELKTLLQASGFSINASQIPFK